MENLKDKKVLVVGLGLQGGGIGLVKYLVKHQVKVTVTDKKTTDQLAPSLQQLINLPVEYHLGGHQSQDFLNADLIFKGPSVPWNLPEIIQAQEKKIPIEMETAFFVKNCPAKIIGITGTRGKTTTTLMIEKLFQALEKKYFLSGNLPQKSAINLLDQVTAEDWVILELSSWQLSGFHRDQVSPHIAIFTNLYPDHFNYYTNIEDYYLDKKAIFAYQKAGDFLIANRVLQPRISQEKIASHILYFSQSDFTYGLKYLKGSHNQENAAAVYKLAELLGFDLEKTKAVIADFSGVPYRQQFIDKKNNVIFINDTTATTPTATIRALQAFSDKPIVLLLGNSSKKLPFNELLPELQKAARIILLKGDFTDQILPELRKLYPEKISHDVFDNFEKAIKAGYAVAQQISQDSQEVYLILSPAAASFAMFNNEFHRGDEFNRIVSNLT